MLRVCLQVGFQEDLVSNSEIQSAGSNSNLSFPASCGISNEVTPDTVQRGGKSSPRVVPAPPLGLETQHPGLGGHRRQDMEVKLGISMAGRVEHSASVCSPVPAAEPPCAPGLRSRPDFVAGV